MIVSILPCDIRHARRCDPVADPLARAFKRILGCRDRRPDRSPVHCGGMWIELFGEAFPLPVNAQAWLERFDDGKEVGPADFEIAVDVSWLSKFVPDFTSRVVACDCSCEEIA